MSQNSSDFEIEEFNENEGKVFLSKSKSLSKENIEIKETKEIKEPSEIKKENQNNKKKNLKKRALKVLQEEDMKPPMHVERKVMKKFDLENDSSFSDDDSNDNDNKYMEEEINEIKQTNQMNNQIEEEDDDFEDIDLKIDTFNSTNQSTPHNDNNKHMEEEIKQPSKLNLKPFNPNENKPKLQLKPFDPNDYMNNSFNKRNTNTSNYQNNQNQPKQYTLHNQYNPNIQQSFQNQNQQQSQKKKRVMIAKPHKDVTDEDLKTILYTYSTTTPFTIVFERLRVFDKYQVKDKLTFQILKNDEESLNFFLAKEECFMPFHFELSSINPRIFLCEYSDVLFDEDELLKIISENEEKGNKCVVIKINEKINQSSPPYKVLPLKKLLCCKPAIPYTIFPLPLLNNDKYFIVHRFYQLRYNIDDLLIIEVTKI